MLHACIFQGSHLRLSLPKSLHIEVDSVTWRASSIFFSHNKITKLPEIATYMEVEGSVLDMQL